MLSRRDFLGALAGSAATLVVPKRKVSYFFGMGLPDPELIHGRPYGMRWSYDKVFFSAQPKTATELMILHEQEHRHHAGACGRCGKVHPPSPDFAKTLDAELSGMLDDAWREVELTAAWLRGEINPDGTRKMALS